MIRRPHLVSLVLGACALACVSGSPPPPATTAAAGTPPPPAVVSAASDWSAPPTNGSPGIDVPKLTGNDLIKNVSFDGGKYIPWMNSFSVPGRGRSFIKEGQFCTEVDNKGVNPWDAQMRHREMVIEKGHIYSI